MGIAECGHCHALTSRGVYTGPYRYCKWIVELTIWMIILTLVKVIICWIMWLTSEELAWFGQVLFEPFQKNIRFELLFVMIVFPGILNVIYFWIIDSYLKSSKHSHDSHEVHHHENEIDSKQEKILKTSGNDYGATNNEDDYYVNPKLPETKDINNITSDEALV